MDFADVPINLNRLRLFLAVVEHGGVRKAAEAIAISQPAVSQAVQALESELSVPLLERIGRHVQPTAAGVLLAEYGRRIFAETLAARQALDELKGLTRGKLAIGASTTIGIYILPDPLGHFHRLHPAVELSLNIANTQQIVRQLTETRLDLAFVEGPVAVPDLSVTSFRKDELVLIAAPGDPLCAKVPVGMPELAEAPFLMREMGSGTREIVQRAFVRWGIVPNVMMELGHTEAIKNAVAAGLGVSILSRMTVARDVAEGRLVTLPLVAGPIQRDLFVVQRATGHLTPASRAFLDLLTPGHKSTLDVVLE